MTDTLPNRKEEETKFSRKKKVSVYHDESLISESDMGRWNSLNDLISKLVVDENNLNEEKLIDFLIPSYRQFVQEFLHWKQNTLLVVSGVVSELNVYSKFVEIGEKLHITPAKSMLQQNNPGLTTLEGLEGNFVASLSINEEEMKRVFYDTAMFSENLRLFLKHSRHYFDEDASGVLKSNQLVKNIVRGKLSDVKKASLGRLMELILEIRIMSDNVLTPDEVIKNLSSSVAALGEQRVEILAMKISSLQYGESEKEILEKLRNVTKVWNNLLNYTNTYTTDNL